MIKPANLEEARALVERYRTMTLAEVERAWNGFGQPWHAALALTGFGDPATCTLCQAVYGCDHCVYWPGHCSGGGYEESYNAIHGARNPQVLLTAFRARADVLERRIHECEESR